MASTSSSAYVSGARQRNGTAAPKTNGDSSAATATSLANSDSSSFVDAPAAPNGESTPAATTAPLANGNHVATNGVQSGGDLATKTKTKKEAIRFAPLNIPIRRRKQTLAVLVHSACLLIVVPLFFFLCAIPLAWPLIIPYILYVLFSSAATDGKLRWRSERFRSLRIWTWFAQYFPAQLVKTADLPADRKYVMGYHPHGIISHGAWAAFATEGLRFKDKFPGIKNSLLTLESNFSIPFYREYLLMAGMRSVSRQSIMNHLTRGGPDGRGAGRAVTIVVGGARESLQANPGTMRLVLHGRYGFVKVAMAAGADLVPVLAFGEVDLYEQVPGDSYPLLHRFQMYALKVWKFTLPFMRGRGVFNYDYGLMPYRRPLNIVVGNPIPVTKATGDILDPAEVERLHGLYVAELRRLWDTYKDAYAPDRKEEMMIVS